MARTVVIAAADITVLAVSRNYMDLGSIMCCQDLFYSQYRGYYFCYCLVQHTQLPCRDSKVNEKVLFFVSSISL